MSTKISRRRQKGETKDNHATLFVLLFVLLIVFNASVTAFIHRIKFESHRCCGR